MDDVTIRVLALEPAPAAGSEGIALERVGGLESALARLAEGGVDVALIPYAPGGEALAAFRRHAPDVPIVAIAREASGLEALEAGASDYVGPDVDAPTLRRALRYATSLQRLAGQLHRHQVIDALTGLYNARGFDQLATHHLRMSDRTQEPVVLVFVRLDDLPRISQTIGAAEGPALVAETADVLRQVVRDSDVLARVGMDTFCVLLTGGAVGAEPLVLSRLVESVATRNARSGQPVPLSLSVGAARYEPGSPVELAELMAEAGRRLRPGGLEP
jgi:diguanylate cyclase (GGDEF)-like protein